MACLARTGDLLGHEVGPAWPCRILPDPGVGVTWRGHAEELMDLFSNPDLIQLLSKEVPHTPMGHGTNFQLIDVGNGFLEELKPLQGQQ